MDKKVWYKIMDVLVAALVLGIASIWYPLGDLLFFFGAAWIIHWGYVVSVVTDDPEVIEKIKSGK